MFCNSCFKPLHNFNDTTGRTNCDVRWQVTPRSHSIVGCAPASGSSCPLTILQKPYGESQNSVRPTWTSDFTCYGLRNTISWGCDTYNSVCQADISGRPVRSAQKVRHARVPVTSSWFEWIHLRSREGHRGRTCLGQLIFLSLWYFSTEIFVSSRAMSTRLWSSSKTRIKWHLSDSYFQSKIW